MVEVLKRMEHQYVGLGSVELSKVRQLALRVQALCCLTAMDSSPADSQMCSTFLGYLNKLDEYVSLAFVIKLQRF